MAMVMISLMVETMPNEGDYSNGYSLCYAYPKVPYYTVLYNDLNPILYYTILYYTILYYTILYYTILYYTMLYYTILYYTISGDTRKVPQTSNDGSSRAQEPQDMKFVNSHDQHKVC